MPRRRLSQPHLERRPTGFYWRRRWAISALTEPDRHRSPASLCVSLRTESTREARELVQRLSALSDHLFAAAAPILADGRRAPN